MSTIIAAPKTSSAHPAGVFEARVKSVGDIYKKLSSWDGKTRESNVVDYVFVTAKGEIRRTYTASYSEGAALLRDMKALTGMDVDGLAELDLKTLVGRPCVVIVEQRKTEKGTFANLSAVHAEITKFEQPAAKPAPVPKVGKIEVPPAPAPAAELGEDEIDMSPVAARPRLNVA